MTLDLEYIKAQKDLISTEEYKAYIDGLYKANELTEAAYLELSK